jgi:hypothetical protein
MGRAGRRRRAGGGQGGGTEPPEGIGEHKHGRDCGLGARVSFVRFSF